MESVGVGSSASNLPVSFTVPQHQLCLVRDMSGRLELEKEKEHVCSIVSGYATFLSYSNLLLKCKLTLGRFKHA